MPPSNFNRHPFWDFVQNLDNPGHGRDTDGYPSLADMLGPLAQNGPDQNGPGPWNPPFDWGAWAPRDGQSRRGRRHHHNHNHGPPRHHHNQQQQQQPREQEPDAATENTDVSPPDTPTSDDTDAVFVDEKGSESTARAATVEDAPDPDEVAPEASAEPDHWFYAGRNGHGHGRGPRGRGRGGPGRCGRGGPPRHGHGPGSDPHGAHPGPPPQLASILRGVMGHPFFQGVADQFQASPESNGSAFSPPTDLFDTPSAYVLHVAVPGAKKGDVGVDWVPDKGALRIAGVVHRPGDEVFLQSLMSAERRVGEFERIVPLPPREGDKVEVDVERIVAKLEDGVLVVTVPKVEREWTQVRKVDIQ